MKLFVALFLLIGCYNYTSAQNVDLAKAYDLMQKKDYGNAIEVFSKILKQKQKVNTHFVYLKRASCYFYLFDYKNAEADAHRALKIKESDEEYKDVMASAIWLLGRIYSRLNRKAESLDYYKQALAYTSNVLLYSTVAYQQNVMGQYDSAVATINYSFKFDGNFAYSYSNRAYAYLKLGKMDEAQSDIQKAIELDPTNPYAFKHRAMINIALSKLDLACADLHQAVALKYSTFGDETDAGEVDELLAKYCK